MADTSGAHFFIASAKDMPAEDVQPIDMLQQADDRALALLAARGDGDAFAALLERHYDRIHRIAWRILGEPSEAEDLAQDICVGLARRIRSFRGDARFTTWLYRVVLNGARDRMRARARHGRLDRVYAETECLERAAAESREAEAAWLRDALAALKPDLRETAVLVLDEGLTQADAGEVLGCAEGTVAWRMAEIRRHLTRMARPETDADIAAGEEGSR